MRFSFALADHDARQVTRGSLNDVAPLSWPGKPEVTKRTAVSNRPLSRRRSLDGARKKAATLSELLCESSLVTQL